MRQLPVQILEDLQGRLARPLRKDEKQSRLARPLHKEEKQSKFARPLRKGEIPHFIPLFLMYSELVGDNAFFKLFRIRRGHCAGVFSFLVCSSPEFVRVGSF